MKKLSVILVMILLLVAALIGCKTTAVNVVKQAEIDGNTYSFIDIDPVVISRVWDKIMTVPLSQFVVEICFRNPDKNAPIQYATLIVTPGGIAFYSYMINDTIYVCEFDTAINSYVSIWDDMTDKNKAAWYAVYSEYFGLEARVGC